MRFLLKEANDLNFSMVNWWAHRDGDKLWEKLKAGGVNEALGREALRRGIHKLPIKARIVKREEF